MLGGCSLGALSPLRFKDRPHSASPARFPDGCRPGSVLLEFNAGAPADPARCFHRPEEEEEDPSRASWQVNM